MLHIPRYAPLRWKPDGTPEAESYNDIYFSREGGLAETQHVFLHGNHLPERFHTTPDFTIIETGFGTGLNFLAAWQAFEQYAPATARLHYLSIEAYPLAPTDLARAHQCWPELTPYAQALQSAYPLPLPGRHRRHFGRVSLTLLYGTADQQLPTLDTLADAWFLDGFAPSKNPEMWNAQLTHALRHHSHQHTTAATFTTARLAKDCLSQAGFTLEKIPGFGRKREMLIAHTTHHAPKPPPKKPEHVTIIGAGIAGLSTARALQQRGIQTTLFAPPALKASDNPAAVWMPHFTADWSRPGRFHSAAYALACHLLPQAITSGVSGQACGLVSLSVTPQEQTRHPKLLTRLGLDPSILHPVTPAEASSLSGLSITHHGIFYPHGGWLSMQELCALWSQNLTLHPTTITQLQQTPDGWQLTDQTGKRHDTQTLILANSYAATQLLSLPLEPVRGQLLHTQITPPKTVLQSGGYLTPSGIAGSSYQRGNADASLRPEEDLSILAPLAHFHPELKTTTITHRWAAIRSATPNRLPLIGEHLPNLHLSLGHGSKGLQTAPLCAELLASQLCREPLPLEPELIK